MSASSIIRKISFLQKAHPQDQEREGAQSLSDFSKTSVPIRKQSQNTNPRKISTGYQVSHQRVASRKWSLPESQVRKNSSISALKKIEAKQEANQGCGLCFKAHKNPKDYVNPKSLLSCPACHEETFVVKGALQKLDELSVAEVAKQKRFIGQQGERFRAELKQRIEKEESEGKKMKDKFQELYKLEEEAGKCEDTSNLTLKYQGLVDGQDELKEKILKRKNTTFTLNDDFTITETVKNEDVSGILVDTHSKPALPRLKKMHRFHVKRPTGAGICPWNENIYICLPEKHVIEVYKPNGAHLKTIESAPGLNFMYPIKVAFDSKNKQIFVLDKWDCNVKILQHLDDDKHSLKDIILAKGDGAGFLQEPCGLALDKEGNIYIADSGNNRVQKVNAKGQPLIMFGGALEKDVFDKDVWVPSLNHPEDININFASTIVVVADTGNHRVKLFDLNGEILHDIGMKGSGHGMFEFPTCAVFHPLSNVILVGDSENHRIQAFNEAGKYLKSYNGHKQISNIATSNIAASNVHQNITLISCSFDNFVIVAK
ncbi:hypothetical protein TCAL_09283 [Tigriopus californicus]|uniref:SMP-30/Gluconolactonase/LRE-like region domain-containing protein n=1 Tax=Tigriopus californicus TaxID=6832 RepID=A0A553PU36_TIGCA|nr:hypothetical protein TCAL_09283 [Tigriopus californicus]|eukprot:TCALIF_09283-PA protein Name:"Similar to nhl-1 RING finger protein nhl-1 (Caenorhabditis elegans)" AED:0.05 eAED:0.05 QI:73/0.8/0.90/1/0.7/0.63/11/113/542